MKTPHPLNPLRLNPKLTAAQCERRIERWLEIENIAKAAGDDPVAQRLAFVAREARRDYADALAVLTGAGDGAR